jgi:hypothetical protein
MERIRANWSRRCIAECYGKPNSDLTRSSEKTNKKSKMRQKRQKRHFAPRVIIFFPNFSEKRGQGVSMRTNVYKCVLKRTIATRIFAFLPNLQLEHIEVSKGA